MKKIAGLLLCCFIGSANAGLLGVDFSDSNGWNTNNSDNWTLGYEFSVTGNTQVDGLGFWDQTGTYNTTTVGLWDSSGTLLGSVDTTSAVNTFATGTGHGTWNFMDFDYLLTAGSYVVGSWGDGMEYTYNTGGGAITTNVLTFVDTREQAGGFFQYPGAELCNGCDGFFGANISFGEISKVPEPAALALLGLGLAGIGFSRKKKSA